MDEEKKDASVISEEERRKEIADTVRIMAVVVATGLGLLLMTYVIPWLKRQFAGSLVMTVIISVLGIGAYFLCDLLVKKDVIPAFLRLTLARIILLAAVLIGAWIF
ncbi:hypothetical protein [Ruminococcus albus]|uniref:Uncharacterized protein n=1 Tax=Ruminococcus albus TaxID=1264 RepID=A0A1I1LJV2_RUMAL|nr:hypothetical protein [Ruminococcus albus]SFC73311.1 hypothetical protein SAMN02910406_02273 [Ruminococcus albus]